MYEAYMESNFIEFWLRIELVTPFRPAHHEHLETYSF